MPIGIPHQEAAIDFIPFLFLAYVVIVVISSLVKAARQMTKTGAGGAPLQPGTPAQTVMTADQVRAALERRLAAVAAARTASVPAAAPAPIIQMARPPISAMPLAAAVAPLPPTPFGLPGDVSSQPVDFATLLQSLPLAAQAIVASAVIGPCAAHRGGGHQPEDW